MGKIADALAKSAIGTTSGRVATTIVKNELIHVWLKGGDKKDRDDLSMLCPTLTFQWGTKTMLSKFGSVHATKAPFCVFKRENNILKIVY